MAQAYMAAPHPKGPLGLRRSIPWRARLQYLYLLRIPILMGLAILSLPFIGLLVFRQLLGNLFILDGWNIFWAVIATEMLAASILVVTRVVLLNGKERFGVRQGLTQDVISLRALVITELLALPMVLAVVFSNGQSATVGEATRRIAFAVGGLTISHVVGFGILWLSILVSPRYHIPADRRFPLPFAFLRRWVTWAYEKNLLREDVRQKFGDTVNRWPPCFTRGYFDPHTHLPYPGQLLSFGMLLLSLGLYEFIGYLKHARLGQSFAVPAIGYLVVLLIVLNWLFSIAAFFLDRYRIPLLVPTLLFVLISNSLANSDHFYETRPSASVSAVSPWKVVHAAFRTKPDKEHPNGRIVVVATAGGGIQAAAWTAQVLTGLQSELKAEGGTNFANSIAVISSVSGGAVGTMFFSSRYKLDEKEPGFPTNVDLSKIVGDAETGALGDIGWALVYPDFTRVAVPLAKRSSNRLIDRGWALEQAWRLRGNVDNTLGDWRNGVEEGWRPGLIFNSTIVESGEPLLLSTTDVNDKPVSGVRRRTLPDLLPGYDVPLVTAVRLAATFPYVTPSSRANIDVPAGNVNGDKLEKNSKYHVVDGGYYDNYGINSLLEFLNEALSETTTEKPPDILLIQIRSFPSDATSPEGRSKGWFYQSWAPIAALMRVRTTGQLLRDQEAISNFVSLWSARGVNIRPATFEFKRADAPLSWQMNDGQKQAIRTEWDKKVNGPDNQDWLDVKCFFHPRESVCQNSPELLKKAAW